VVSVESTTVWHVAAELAMRGKRVRIEDLDQGAHLTRVFDAHPLGLATLHLGGTAPADVVILDTAPEADQARALEYLRRSDWVLVPVKVVLTMRNGPLRCSWAGSSRSALCA
jgi:hypothetical protein